MGAVLAILTSRLAGPIASALCIILLGLMVGQCSGRLKAEHEWHKAEKVAKQARADLGTCQSNEGALNAALVRQNAAVEAFRQDAAARVAESQKQASAARSVAASYRRQAQAILNAKPKGTACEAADALINEAIQ